MQTRFNFPFRKTGLRYVLSIKEGNSSQKKLNLAPETTIEVTLPVPTTLPIIKNAGPKSLRRFLNFPVREQFSVVMILDSAFRMLFKKYFKNLHKTPAEATS